jgi:4-hydroxythreonine-4-phosphate dehydrogenase
MNPDPTRPDEPIRIAVTCGDPAGVGPEVALKALTGSIPPGVEPVLVGPQDVWRASGSLLSRPPDLSLWQILHLSPAVETDWAWGRPTPGSGTVAAQAVEAAARLALEGRVQAVVTAPLTKAGLRAANRPFPGHTEFLAHLCGAAPHRATMMLVGERLRVVLVTTHLPLAEVPGAVCCERVLRTIEAAHGGLSVDLGIPSPRIAVAALNPHAGEGGAFGTEERREIEPAVEQARASGIDATGPFPADSLFYRAAEGAFDAVVAMYHDQGLVALKLLHFHNGVNVTLGLPIVRTSPDHGTAFDIAGRGVARDDSFREAVRLAATIARRRRRGASALRKG